MLSKTLDEKLAALAANPDSKAFVLADAKDADMAAGVATPGPERTADRNTTKYASRSDYLQHIRENVRDGLLDIMLMSVRTSDQLTLRERLFDDSPVTPAIRANDTTDVWFVTGGVYRQQPALPCRNASLAHALHGRLGAADTARPAGADLGLFSVTFNNDAVLDRDMLQSYRDFRLEAESLGFRHFLEVFDPAAPVAPIADLPRFLNDHIARTLAAFPAAGGPLFLKIPYHGPAALEQLRQYDSSLVIGILGGAAGTTLDAFHQLWEARRYGARAALYGRMINQSEHQPSFIRHLRWLADGDLDDPREAVRSYHGTLEQQGIAPDRPLADDLVRSGT
jgi:hypothetical protein